MLGQYGKSQKQQPDPLPSPALYMPHDVNPGTFARTTTTGQVYWSSMGSDCEGGCRNTTGQGQTTSGGLSAQKPCALSSLCSQHSQEGLSSLCLLKAPANTTGRLTLKFPEKSFSQEPRHATEASKTTSSPPASPAQHKNKLLLPRIVWVDGESQNLRTEIIQTIKIVVSISVDSAF